MSGEFVTIALVRKTQGNRGEVAAEVHTAVPDRFQPGMRLSALLKDGQRKELELEEFWPHKGMIVLKFGGFDSISDAETLVGAELQVSERAQLERGWNYVSDLVGCRVWDRDREIGSVKEVIFGAGEAPLLLVTDGKQEFEIPFAEAYLVEVSTTSKTIRMNLPEGLLEVNAPLTAEEKAEQNKQ
jgi:16S rRNA processing protein RimM